MIKTTIAIRTEENERYHTAKLSPESGWHRGIHLSEPSMASDIWKNDVADIFRSFLKYIEDDPLRSRIIGYQIASRIYSN